jgi:hypothetical protein
MARATQPALVPPRVRSIASPRSRSSLCLRRRSPKGANGSGLSLLWEAVYLVSMDKPWNPVVVGFCGAAMFSAIVAIDRMFGLKAPLTFETAAIGGMLVGGLAAIITNLLPPKR